jgi:hypothetical protein
MMFFTGGFVNASIMQMDVSEKDYGIAVREDHVWRWVQGEV